MSAAAALRELLTWAADEVGRSERGETHCSLYDVVERFTSAVDITVDIARMTETAPVRVPLTEQMRPAVAPPQPTPVGPPPTSSVPPPPPPAPVPGDDDDNWPTPTGWGEWPKAPGLATDTVPTD